MNDRSDDHDRATPPWPLRVAAGWSWRVLVIGAAVYALVLIFLQVSVLVLGVIAAFLLAALLKPVTDVLRERAGLPDALAAGLTVLLLLGVLGLAGWFVSQQITGQIDELQQQVAEAIDQIRDALAGAPLSLDPQAIDRIREQLLDQIQNNRGRVVNGALSGATVAFHVAVGAVIALFTLFFLLKDGERMWQWTLRLFNSRRRPDIDGAGRLAWFTLAGYTHGVVLVALIDAVFIGLALFLLGVPLVLPLALVTFLGAFVPILGAFVAGLLAVLVALVTQGVVTAALVLLAIVVVQQIEGNVLQPIIMSQAVHLHPLVTVLAVTAGSTLAGIAGAIVAVPIVALIHELTAYFSRTDREQALTRRRLQRHRTPSQEETP